MKNNRQYLFLVLILAIGVAAVFFVFSRKQESQVSLEIASSPMAEAKAQSYAAKLAPEAEDEDLTFGSAKAPLLAFVYEDYSSPYSAALADTLERLRQESDGRLGIIIRPFILDTEPLSQPAALSVWCAAEQGKWKEMRAFLFSQAKTEQLQEDSLAIGAGEIGLDQTAFSACLTNSQKSERIEGMVAQAGSYGVLGAPTMFLGQEMILGARPYDDFVDSNGDTIEGLGSLVKRKLE